MGNRITRTGFASGRFVRRLAAAGLMLCGFTLAAAAQAALTVTPLTWNIIGLDSNSPATGPKNFPVGARVCSDIATTDAAVQFVFDSANAFVTLRAGSLSTLNFASIPANGCVDAYFEVEVMQTAAAFDTTRAYHITATDPTGTYSTPTPREFYVEHLVSQARNAITDVRYGLTPGTLQAVGPGGALNLVVGNTYTIELSGGTATQGYEQFEAFINFSNAVFQILSVSTTYSADSSNYVTSPSDKLYADACLWENDPNSPNYRACVGVPGKAGGSNVVTTYTIRIVSGGGTSQTLNTLLYDFSGSSFHYNGDYSTGARIANLIDPTSATIAKSFSPNPMPVNGVSALTLTLGNPNAGALGGFAVTDTLPAGMTIASPANAMTSGCGTPTLSAPAGGGTITFSNGTVAGNGTCIIKVDVTTNATGNFLNTTGTLFVDGVNTNKTASDTLVVNNAPPPGTGICGLPRATWLFPTGFTVGAPAPSTGSGTALAGAGLVPNSQTTLTADGSSAWGSNGSITTGATLVAANNEYFEFGIDTTGLTSVTMNWNMQQKSGNGPQGVALYAGTGVAPGTLIFSNATAMPTQNTTAPSTQVVNTGLNPSGITFFRVYSFNSGNVNPGADPVIDDVVFTACSSGVQPTIAKGFSPNPVAVGGVSTLTFTLTNANAAALTVAAFTDALPAGTQVAATPAAATTCGGTWAPTPGATSLSFSAGTIPASGTCTVRVNVTATTAGPHINVSGFLSTLQTGTTTTSVATATLTTVSPPQIAKRFAPSPMLAGATSRLTFTIINPNPNDALGGVGFTDTFPVAPGAMRVAAVPNAGTSGCGAPTFAPAAGSGSISLSGATLAAGATCSVVVDVTAPTVGTYNNLSGPVAFVINAQTVNGNAASASLQVEPPSPSIALLKQVGPTAVGPWTSFLALNLPSNVFYRFTMENTGDVPLSTIALSDDTFDVSSCLTPATLPVAVAANDDHIFSCVVGPAAAQSGSLTNTAMASGIFSGSPVTDQSSATYASTALTLDKTAVQASFTLAGDVLNYNYLVTNSGFAVLSGPITVTDDRATVTCPALNTVGDLDNFLDPGESITCSATYVVTAGDVTAASVTNTASASNGSTTSNIDQATVPLSTSADVSVVKTLLTAGPFTAGQSIQYSLFVANAGPSTATNVQVTDTPTNLVITNVSGGGCAALPCTIPSLAAGADTTITVTATITASGAFDNTVTVSATQPDPVLPNNTDDAGNGGSTGITQVPVIGIAKTASAAVANPDGTFTTGITLTVANLGNEVLNAVSIVDTLSTAAGGSFGTYTAVLPAAAGQYTVTSIGAAGLTANVGFTGDGPNTQVASGSLAIAQTATVTFTLRFFPSGAGPFANQAIASGTGATSGTPTSDLSDDGTLADSDDDGDPNEPGENDPTPIGITLAPSVGIAKAANAATSNGDGTFSTNITLTVSNLGNEALNAVTVTDALATGAGGSFGTFATPADAAGEYTITGLSASGLTATAGFTGAPGNTQAASGTLAIGQTATVSFTLTFFPNAAGPFNNQALATGTGAISTTGTNDSSDNGTDPDANDNGNPGDSGEDDPTPIGITLTPQVGIAKAATAATSNGDGTFSTDITLTVSNLGNEALNAVSVTDALATTAGGNFGTYSATAPDAAGEYTVAGLTAAGLAPDGTFTGEVATSQAASGTLAIGQTATVSFTLTFFPDAAGPFNNQAIASATGATSGTNTSDDSDDGTDPDANGDGDPTGPNEDDPTPIAITLTPVVGIAKAASAAVDNGDGTFTTVVVLTAENLGNEVLTALTLTDALATADGGSFGTYTAGVPAAVGSYTVTGISAAGLSADAGFTGAGATQTVATGSLAIGQTATATFTLRFVPEGTGPFNNQALAAATGGTSGTPTNDSSDDGTNPDADGDSNPNEPGENDPTPVSITLTPRIGIAKSVTGAVANGDGSSSTTVTLTVENLGNEALVAVDVTDALATAAGGTFGTYTPGNPGAAGQYTVTAVSAAGLMAVPTFTGAGTDLSVATGALAIGQTATATFTLRFFPDRNGPLNNQAEAEGTGASSTQGTTDLSDNGLDPDPNGDGDANDPDEDDPTPVTPAIALPTATDDGVSTPINTPVTVPVLDNDTFGTDGPSATPVTITIAPANGTATVDDGGTPNDPSDDQIVYTPNPGFTGVDTVTYRICDANGDCTTAQVTITITAGTVVAVDDADTTAQDTPVTTDVLDNDTTTGQPLDPGSVTITVDSPDGTTTVNPDGSITFTPNPGFNGTTTYTYEVCDTTNPTPVCDTAIVTILVPIGSADLTVLKTGPANTEPGEQIVFTIEVENLGPDPASAVLLTDPTPAGLQFVSNTGDCTTAFPCALGDMAVGDTRTVLATFLVPDDYTGSPTIINIATVTSETPDPTPGDTSSSASTLVEGGAPPPPPAPQPLNIPVDDRWAMLLLGLAMLLLAGSRLRRMG